MLHLKRASAGSGKTYELAKTYIKLLLTHKEPRKRRQLRSEQSLQEALSSILAVTFTVKATAEMKQRIVEKLSDLARADEIIDENEALKIDYLKEFITELRTTRFEIARLAKKALRTLLLHYTDFKVQTIDSFFQSILHTFAYEATLDDNFNMEMDTAYVSSVGFDAALDSLSQSAGKDEKEKELLYWLKKMMTERRETNKWNVFAKVENANSLYQELIKEAENLEKENFQNKRAEVEKYFASLEIPFREQIEKVDRAVISPWETLHERRKVAAETLLDTLKSARLEPSHLYGKSPAVILNSLADFDEKKIKKYAAIGQAAKKTEGYSLSGEGLKEFKATVSKYSDINSSKIHEIDSDFVAWRDLHNEYMQFMDREMLRLETWRAYRSMLPCLMVVMEIAGRKREFLESTNSLQISDTNHILAQIIGEDDTPFVYERMGSRLQHYLIDEFQDTSPLQWKNLRPLVAESEGSDNDNLIIGDAKQSIYRFRNADYKLILRVGEEFRNVVPYTSDTPPEDMGMENTNYRSKPRVVEFNNYLFSEMTGFSIAGKEGEKPLFNPAIKEIYRDTVQAIPEKRLKDRQAPAGYVEVVFHPKKSKEEDEESDSKVSITNEGFRVLPEKILELRDRGYEFRDIGVLVKSHDQGTAIVSVITAYNALHPDNRISIISEENLLVGSSTAVRIVVHALEMASKGVRSQISDNTVLKEPVDETELFELLKTLPTLSLPSLVEAILEKFVPVSMRKAETPFIAAFQDAVIDYCAGHPGDIGSFLKWWQRKAMSLAINSPEDSDGVKIQTIHKAKGLEYKCVIIPYADFNFEPSSNHSEWRWVRPSEEIPGHELLPPYLPIKTTGKLKTTYHSDIREEYCEEVALDELNKMYVGFTRAVNELYIYVPVGRKPGKKTSAAVMGELLSHEKAEISAYLTEPLEIEEKEDDIIEIRYGRPATARQLASEKKKKETTPINLDSYEVMTKGALLQFENGNKYLNSKVHLDENDRLNPRAEGSLKHRIMQEVTTIDDLGKSLLELQVAGLISSSQASLWRDELSEAIGRVKDYGWFDAGMRVLNERPILQRELKKYRPDRIVVDSEGNASVIDYKFGSEEPEYRRQVSNYARLLEKTGTFKTVKAYIWYIPDNRIITLN